MAVFVFEIGGRQVEIVEFAAQNVDVGRRHKNRMGFLSSNQRQSRRGLQRWIQIPKAGFWPFHLCLREVFLFCCDKYVLQTRINFSACYKELWTAIPVFPSVCAVFKLNTHASLRQKVISVRCSFKSRLVRFSDDARVC